jgi:hypothetical protein
MQDLLSEPKAEPPASQPQPQPLGLAEDSCLPSLSVTSPCPPAELELPEKQALSLWCFLTAPK